jgi:hypothetical protein
MRAYLPYVYGGLAALIVLRGSARGGFGTAVQGYFASVFVETSTQPEA